MSDIQERTTQKRKEQYDKTAIAWKTFKEGQLVLTRNPGLHSKLDSVWDGPFEVMEVPNDMHVIIATPGNGREKRKRVHVNFCTKFSTPESQVRRLVVSAADDPYLDEPKVVLSVAKGFYQIGLTEQARARSAFVTPMGKFEFLRMPFGMRNAPSTFQRLMDIVLEGKESFCTAYIDDILVYSSTGAEHIGHVNEVLEVLVQQNGLTAKPSKCVWGMETVEYLGHRIGKGEIAVPEARTRQSSNTKSHRSSQTFEPAIAQPLTAALRKAEPKEVIWIPEREEAFDK